MNLTIDQVIDNGDNSLTITAHEDDGTEHVISNGRKSELPSGNGARMTYYEQVVRDSLPPEQPVLYVTPEYTAKIEEQEAAEADSADDPAPEEESVDT